MKDFRTADPSQMNPGVLRERVEFLKTIKGGEVIVSGVLEEYVERRLKEQAIALQHQMEKEREMEREQLQKENKRPKRENDAFAQVAVKSLLECGISMEQVSMKTKLPMERVQQIAKDLDLQKKNKL